MSVKKGCDKNFRKRGHLVNSLLPFLMVITLFPFVSSQMARADFTVAYDFSSKNYYKPAAAGNTQTGDFLVAYLDPVQCTGPSPDWEVRATLRNSTGDAGTIGLAPLGACNHRAVGRPAVAYSPQSDVFCVAAPTTNRPSGLLIVRVGFVKGDGTLVEPFNVYTTMIADSFFDGPSGHGSCHVVYNSILNEFVVTAQVIQSGTMRVWAQRISPSGSTIGSVVELMGAGANSHGLAYAPVSGTSPSGGRYLFVNGGGGVKLLDSELNPMFVTCHVDQHTNQTICDGDYIGLWYGDDEPSGNSNSGESQFFDVAYGEVEGQKRFLMVYTDTDNVTPGIGTYFEHTGIWGIFVDPERIQYDMNTTDDIIYGYPTPFPIINLFNHMKADLKWKPRVTYSSAAQAFAVVWKETPTLDPLNGANERYSHIRGAWVEKYVEDGRYGTDVEALYGYPPGNLVISDVSAGSICIDRSPYDACESYEDPDFPDVAPVGGGTVAAVWDAMLDPPPSGLPPFVIDLPPRHSIRGDLFPVLPAPSNDNRANASSVVVGQHEGTLVRATNDGSASCGSSTSSPDIWYRFQATGPGKLLVTTCGTNDYFGTDMGIDTVLSLHSPTDGSQIINMCNDDWPSGNYNSACLASDTGVLRDSALQYGMTSGQTVLIRVAPYGTSKRGPIRLNVAFENAPDVDGDGYTVGQGDCNDNDNTIYPGAPELCDGKDNDCSGGTTDGSGENWYGAACDGPDTDSCKEGIFNCSGGAKVCSDNTGNAVDICDGIDNDCNPATADGSVESWYGTSTTCGTGECSRTGQFVCSGGVKTNTCVPGVPGIEICDGKDNNCNGQIDEGTCFNTPSGQEVPVSDPSGNITVTFGNVTQPGNTTFTTVPCGNSPWEGFTYIPADNHVCVEIETTAAYQGGVKICIKYDDTGLTPAMEQKLVMIHCDDQGKCSSIPCNPLIPVDTVNNVVCGCTTGFSTFGVGFFIGCQADLNNDGSVDGSDVSAFIDAYGTYARDPEYVPGADFDGNGRIDQEDLDVMAMGLGKSDCPIP